MYHTDRTYEEVLMRVYFAIRSNHPFLPVWKAVVGQHCSLSKDPNDCDVLIVETTELLQAVERTQKGIVISTENTNPEEPYKGVGTILNLIHSVSKAA